MAKSTLTIAGRSYEVGCRDGEEEKLHGLAMLVDEKAQQVRAAVGGGGDARQLLLAALLLADEVAELRGGKVAPLPADTGTALADAIEQLAWRVETLADHLEGSAPNA